VTIPPRAMTSLRGDDACAVTPRAMTTPTLTTPAR
jgi:hypothetical protein